MSEMSMHHCIYTICESVSRCGYSVGLEDFSQWLYFTGNKIWAQRNPLEVNSSAEPSEESINSRQRSNTCKWAHVSVKSVSIVDNKQTCVLLRQYNCTLDGAESATDVASLGHTRDACRPHRVWLVQKKGFPKPEALNGAHAGSRNSPAATRPPAPGENCARLQTISLSLYFCTHTWEWK